LSVFLFGYPFVGIVYEIAVQKAMKNEIAIGIYSLKMGFDSALCASKICNIYFVKSNCGMLFDNFSLYIV